MEKNIEKLQYWQMNLFWFIFPTENHSKIKKTDWE